MNNNDLVMIQIQTFFSKRMPRKVMFEDNSD